MRPGGFDEAVGGDGVGESGEGREIAEGEMNLATVAIGTEILDALAKVGSSGGFE